MKLIIRAKKCTIVFFFLIFIITICTISAIVGIKLKGVAVCNELKENRTYLFTSKNLSSYEEYCKHVVEEYKGKKVIALTYDDGPGRYTDDLLEILKKYNAKATFFILGSCVSEHKDIIDKAYLMGNEIATHGYSHKIMTNLSKEALMKDIQDSLDVISPNITENISLIRPPYGLVNDDVNSVFSTFNLTCVKWDLDSLDWKLRNTEQVTSRVLKQVSDKKVILMHDIYKTSVEATENIIRALMDEYYFITVSELLILKQNEF